MSVPKVYFTKTITPEKLIEMYEILNKPLPGKIGIKIHSGEAGNQNFIKPEFFRPILEKLKGTIIEANTAGSAKSMEGHARRYCTESHKKVLEEHGWTKLPYEILDEKGELTLENPKAFHCKENYVGAGIKNYDSCVVISHFKGHGLGGFGGALKQLSIGFASNAGKCWLHSGGKAKNPDTIWQDMCESIVFKESMADAAKTVHDFYKGNIVYINVICNISVDCDCAKNAKPPCMKDIGICASVDPVAIDQACLDLVYKSDDPGKKELIERIEKLHGKRIIEASVELGTGSDKYEMINLD